MQGLHNNFIENVTRPFVIGRKNSFALQHRIGSNGSANLYSLIETAKTNGLKPYTCLKQVLAELLKAMCVEYIKVLLPA